MHFLHIFTQGWLRPSRSTLPKSSAPTPILLNTSNQERFYFRANSLTVFLPTSVRAPCGQGISMQHPENPKYWQSHSSLSINALNVWKAYEKYKLQADLNYWRANNLEPVTNNRLLIAKPGRKWSALRTQRACRKPVAVMHSLTWSSNVPQQKDKRNPRHGGPLRRENNWKNSREWKWINEVIRLWD